MATQQDLDRYLALESAYTEARAVEDEAREKAHRKDGVNAGWDKVRELEAATEAARQALIAAGEMPVVCRDDDDDD
jgi:hypothetical protein